MPTRPRKAATDPAPAPVVPTPVPPLPPLPADVLSVGWWQAAGVWAVTTATWVALLIGHPFASTTLTTVTTAVGIVASIAPFVAALITHGKVKAAVINYHGQVAAARLRSDAGYTELGVVLAVLILVAALWLGLGVTPWWFLLLLLIVAVAFL